MLPTPLKSSLSLFFQDGEGQTALHYGKLHLCVSRMLVCHLQSQEWLWLGDAKSLGLQGGSVPVLAGYRGQGKGTNKVASTVMCPGDKPV